MADLYQLDWRPEPALYSKKQAAIFLGISVRTVGNLLRVKALVRRKVGRKTLIPKTSLEAFLRKDHATQETEKAECKPGLSEKGDVNEHHKSSSSSA